MTEELMAVLSMVGTLLLVIAVLVAAYFATRMVAKGYGGSLSTRRNMEVLDRLPLGKDQSLLVVRVGGRVLLLGCTPNHIQALEELNPGDYEKAEAAASQPGTDFLSVWKTVLGRGKQSPSDAKGRGEE